MNTNAFHNLLNFVAGIIGIALATDWTVFGLDAATAAKVAAATLVLQNVVKLGINIYRDGVTGLVKEQPPVES